MDTLAIIAKRLPAGKRNLDLTDRLDDLGIDSFNVVEMIFDLEEKFDIQIPYNSNETRPDFATLCRVNYHALIGTSPEPQVLGATLKAAN
jgi:acyl carrier protein